MYVRDQAGEYQHIQCDGCDTISPPPAELLAGHGLVNMGWDCRGGAHYCPRCKTFRAIADA